MKIVVQRGPSSSLTTIGELFINGGFHCFTLEPPVRSPGVKIAGKTAIPAAIFVVKIDFSPHFSRPMPEIVGVPNFSGVRFHWGDFARDTEGCLITGYTRAKDFVGESKIAFEALFLRIEAAEKVGEEVTVDIRDYVPEEAATLPVAGQKDGGEEEKGEKKDG